jgi:hypothetical protein
LNCCYYYETPLGTIGIAESDGKITHRYLVPDFLMKMK